MNINYIQIEKTKEQLRNDLTEKRYLHTIRTVNKAMELSYGTCADKDVVFMAALLHDCAKYKQPTDEDLALLKDFVDFPPVFHAPFGAVIAEREYGIKDKRILNAIAFHTTGRANMTLEEKIVFLADAIEDGRQYENVENIRNKAKISLEAGILTSLEGTVAFETVRKNNIHPLTLEAIDFFKKKI